jgi:hypothetical protein
MLLRWLISAIGFATLKGEVSAMVQRAAQRAVLMLMVLLLWLGAFSFALAALAVWLSSELGPIAAYGIIAGGFAIIGIFIQIGLAVSANNRKKAAPKISIPGFTPNADGTQTPDVANLGSMAVIAIAGFLLGRQIFRK